MGKTIARTKILKIIRLAIHPINYTDIKEKMGSSCSRVTIYRLLLKLERENLIYRFPDFNGDFRYSYCTDKGVNSKYNHFQCLQCNTVFNLNPEKIQTTIPANYQAETMHLLTCGTCPRCRDFNNN